MKPWYKSKTIWFNIGTGLVSIGNEFAAVADALPSEYQTAARVTLATVIAVGNLILRRVTTQAIV